jgi:Zn-dependent protease
MILIGWIFALLIALTVHEAAHAWMADRLGDPTARLMGRLSLNPLVHYDTVGTTILLVSSILAAVGTHVFPFGWAKPVQFDPYNLQNPRRDSAMISLAGPASNLLFALIASILFRLIGPMSIISQNFLIPLIELCVSLAIFNLVPIHPLDGGKIFIGLLPERDAAEADLFLRRYGTLLLFFLIFPVVGGTSPVFLVISPVIRFIISLLLPGIGVI